ncbi:MAG: FAD-binding oxidoreductase [Proteobacteria bacterium]|nr:FAD-binding oxidoreductase [Pseudomonadota bacterium]
MSSPVDDPTQVPAVYAQSAPPALNAPALAERITAQVAIVGAGYTGLSTALHLAEAGVAAGVLEGREVGWGGSGRAFGQVVPYTKHADDHVLATFGPERGERLIAAVGGGPDLVFELIAKHGMDCQQIKRGLLFAAHNAGSVASLERRARFWQARGAPLAVHDGAAAEALIGSRYYPAVLHEPRGGCLNPLAYARGLARAAISAGARLFEDSRATAITRTGTRWTVTTAHGAVEAEHVVLATDAYTDDLWPGLRRSIIPLRGYSMTSAPLTDNLRRTVLPGGESLSDTRRLYSAIRVRADGRLQVSVDGPPFTAGATPFADKASRRVRQLFPQLGDVVWDGHSTGWVGMTADQYPHVHLLAQGVIAAVGLNGRGIAIGTLLGREVAGRVLGRPEHEQILPLTPLKPLAIKPIARIAVGGLIKLYRALDRRDLANGYVRPAE